MPYAKPVQDLSGIMDSENRQKLDAVKDPRVFEFIKTSASLCRPDEIFICSDSAEDIAFCRTRAVETGEEMPLETAGHTCHFDGIKDQGRDREATKYLVPDNGRLDEKLNQKNRDKGLAEINRLMDGAMKNRTMIVRFLCLGPVESEFSIPCLQCTDSWYVAHCNDLLYRPAYEMFKAGPVPPELFRILHSAGETDERMISAEPEKKRIYIDYAADTIYSVNTQYAGNTVGLKKLALRLTIRKADREGWLAEHMLLMGVRGRGGRKTYLAGAFPSACGKTATAMLPGESILGDDIAYLREKGGKVRAANAESGIFGILQNVNANDYPAIYRVLTSPGEVIFSNVLVSGGKPYWTGMGVDIPAEGENFSGRWYRGKRDESGNEIPFAHKNARYTVALRALENCDPELDSPEGVRLEGIMYGGRDAGGYPPVQQSFSWEHGIAAYGASLETETTFATTGESGIPEINLMSIQDFVSIPLGKYISNNIEFGKKLKKPPAVFGVNYFLRDSRENFVNEIEDKHVWIKWMELRIHGEAGAKKYPTGWIPVYRDLKKLFREVLGKNYTIRDYRRQFTLRVPENMAKLDRVEKYHGESVPDCPEIVSRVLREQRARLEKARELFGDYIPPEKFQDF